MSIRIGWILAVGHCTETCYLDAEEAGRAVTDRVLRLLDETGLDPFEVSHRFMSLADLARAGTLSPADVLTFQSEWNAWWSEEPDMLVTLSPIPVR